jgi:hypothetical protein
VAFDPRNFNVALDGGGVCNDDCHEICVVGLFSSFVSSPGVFEDSLDCGLTVYDPSEFAAVSFLP